MVVVKSSFIWLWISLMGLTVFGQDQKVYNTSSGSVYFLSDAPLEMISASSDQLKGVLNIEDRQFSFSIPVNTFEGFNSALQKIHFNENYLETDVFPKATFKGKIIEEVDLGMGGQYWIRASNKRTPPAAAADTATQVAHPPRAAPKIRQSPKTALTSRSNQTSSHSPNAPLSAFSVFDEVPQDPAVNKRISMANVCIFCISVQLKNIGQYRLFI